jgi:hypothetical protein
MLEAAWREEGELESGGESEKDSLRLQGEGGWRGGELVSELQICSGQESREEMPNDGWFATVSRCLVNNIFCCTVVGVMT